MFGNRKRKSDEDDSLVPHGLIWHAIQPAPPDAEKSAQNSSQRAEVIEITRPPATSGIEQQPQSIEPSALSKFPSDDEKNNQSTTAPPSSPSEVPASQPAPPITPLAPKSSVQRLRVAEIIEIAPAASDTPDAMEFARRAITRLGIVTVGVRNAVLRLSGKAHGELVKLAQWADSKRQNPREAQMPIKFRKSMEHANQHAQRLKASTIQAGRITQEESRRVFESLASAYSEARNRISAQSSSWRTGRVRVVLTGAPLRIKLLFVRRLVEWKITQAGSTGDERLRSSMTFAAISATVVLIIISVVPRYAAKSLPSRLLGQNAAVTAKNTKSSMAVPVSGNLIVKPAALIYKTAPTKARKSEPKPKSSHAAVRTPPRKIYRTAEDDYIAPDTYIYYGKKSLPTR
ncbi:MAG TPA: hypothetical protein VJO35_09055 [Terriglobales bacterium]|nr:hypothetical protein [Terriglobales bacterium]